MNIYIGADHAGYKLKERMKPFLEKLGYTVIDKGNTKLQKTDDYPDYGYKVAKEVAKNKSKGILFCGSAEGICIVANKVKGIRAVAVRDTILAKLSRSHNDANILCLPGGDMKEPKPSLKLPDTKAKQIIKTWLSTPFSNAPRHKRRIKKISAIERKQ
jgi:RpiB/LacA/LacB family sugar-phosphate isomerase